MRIGTTSYMYPADILTNVRRLAGRTDDIELLFLEVDDDLNRLPDASVMAELGRIAATHDMTYTVHLPLDLTLAAEDNRESVEKALKVIRATRDLRPFGYVLHIESGQGNSPTAQTPGLDFAVDALERLAEETGDPGLLCAENSFDQSFEIIDEILRRSPVSCCLDVGHLWSMGADPLPIMARRLPRTRIVHLHGVGERDHKPLTVVSSDTLDPVTHFLYGSFHGVLTLELFKEADWLDSLDELKESAIRLGYGDNT